MIFSILSLVGVIGFTVWWSTQYAVAPSIEPTPSVETSTNGTDTGSFEAIEAAKRAKDMIETRSTATLDLSGQGLTQAPAYIFDKTYVEELDLSNNLLTGSLQAEVRHLQNLKVLNLSNNNFTGVPAEVGQLKKLEILDLSNNKLTGLPYELGNLSNLKVLNISGNNYSAADLAIIKKSLPASTVITTN